MLLPWLARTCFQPGSSLVIDELRSPHNGVHELTLHSASLILVTLFFGVPAESAMIVVTAMTEPGVYDPMVLGPN